MKEKKIAVKLWNIKQKWNSLQRKKKEKLGIIFISMYVWIASWKIFKSIKFLVSVFPKCSSFTGSSPLRLFGIVQLCKKNIYTKFSHAKNLYENLGTNWLKKNAHTRKCRFVILEMYRDLCQISKVYGFAKIINSWKPLTICAKCFILDVCQGSGYASMFYQL